MLRTLLFAIAILAVSVASQSFTTDGMEQHIFFHNAPQRYAPYSETNGIKVRGDCKNSFSVESKFVIIFSNAADCTSLQFDKPSVNANELTEHGTTDVKAEDGKCANGQCTQVMSMKTTGIDCNADPMHASDIHQDSISFSMNLAGQCGGIARNFGRVGVRVAYQISDTMLARASRLSHIDGKRSVFRARAPIGAACMANTTCTCDAYCNASVCTALVEAEWRNSTCSALNPPGSPPCVTFYCNPSDVYTYDTAVSDMNCGAIYEDVQTNCTFVTEPGAAYATTTGICQGGYEGYCLSNNQAQFIETTASTSSDTARKVTDKFNVDSSHAGEFIEGGFNLFVGTDQTDPVQKQHGLPLEFKNAITPPWLHADDTDTLVGFVKEYPIDGGLVDDDEDNHDVVLESLRTGVGIVNCNLTLLLDENGYGIDYCSGQANTTTPSAVLLNGTYTTPRSHDFLRHADDDDDNDDGGDQLNNKLKKKGKFCSPVCYCKNVTFDGVAKYQIAYCTRGFWPTAGDQGDEDNRWIVELGYFLPTCWLIVLIMLYALRGTYGGLVRHLSTGNLEVKVDVR